MTPKQGKPERAAERNGMAFTLPLSKLVQYVCKALCSSTIRADHLE